MARVVTPEDERPAALHIRQGVITDVTRADEVAERVFPLDVGDSIVMPGLVDSHVHLNEPGRAEWVEAIFLRGRRIYQEGLFDGSPHGRLIPRGNL